MRVGRGISLPHSNSVGNCIQVGHPSGCPLNRSVPAALARASATTRHSHLNRSAPRCVAQNRLLVVSEPRSPLKRRLQRLARTAVARPSHPRSAPRCVAQNRVLVVPEPRPSPKHRPRRVTRTTAGRGASVGRMLFHVVVNWDSFPTKLINTRHIISIWAVFQVIIIKFAAGALP